MTHPYRVVTKTDVYKIFSRHKKMFLELTKLGLKKKIVLKRLNHQPANDCA